MAPIAIFTVVKVRIKIAENNYAHVQSRCGHEPIVLFYSAGGLLNFESSSPVLHIFLGIAGPQPGQKYYCTLKEAVNDGFNLKEIKNAASKEIQDLYP